MPAAEIISQTRICKNCKGTFTLAPWAVRSKAGKYCSQKCYWDFKNKGWRERFWEKVAISELDECWPWSGTCFEQGYGIFSRVINGKKKSFSAHRIAFKLTRGPIPKGLLVRHKCDNPPCCNPAHLETGTYMDNSHDRDKRGRANTARGSRQGHAKLTEEIVREIRRRADGATQQALADAYDISRATIRDVIHIKTWKHVQ